MHCCRSITDGGDSGVILPRAAIVRHSSVIRRHPSVIRRHPSVIETPSECYQTRRISNVGYIITSTSSCDIITRLSSHFQVFEHHFKAASGVNGLELLCWSFACLHPPRPPLYLEASLTFVTAEVSQVQTQTARQTDRRVARRLLSARRLSSRLTQAAAASACRRRRLASR